MLSLSNLLLMTAVPVLLAIVFIATPHPRDIVGFDFRGSLWDPGKAILDGHNPYLPPHSSALRTGNPPVYPPVFMLIVAPLTLLPWAIGLAVWLVLMAAAIGAALWLLNVRDPWIYAIAFSSSPVLIGWQHGNLLLMLLLGLAVSWRWRDQPLVAGVSVAALVAAKLFLWPLLIWLVVTKRVRAALYSAGFVAIAVLGSWAIIGLDGFRDYPQLLRAYERLYVPHSQSPTAFWISLGLSATTGAVLAFALGLTVLLAGVCLARREDGDRRMFSAAVVAAIALTPIAWFFFYALLLVPLALYRPTLSRIWVIPLAFWIPLVLEDVFSKGVPCCRPAGMSELAWSTLASRPTVAYLGGCLALWAMTGVVTVVGVRPWR